MRFKLLSAIAAVVSIATFQSAANAITFNFIFDNTDDGGVNSPLVGSGIFNFDGDPGDGTFSLSDLPNYNFNFELNTGDVFTTSDITTPIDEVLTIISSNTSAREVNFSNINGFGSGTEGGSIDFRNASGSVLSFEPPGTGGNLDLYFVTAQGDSYFGNYQGIAVSSVPEPSTNLALLTFSAVGVGLLLRRKQKKVTVKI
ncbi:MAG TPA: PEP-CTERM sorting domain-containing protein [Oculatellaceae cyanobacterium]|jgi:hypothetical protein